MKADIKQRWVAALRSGIYKQGKSALCKSDGTFCCLGVLCDLVVPDQWGELLMTSIVGIKAREHNGESFLPSSSVLDAAGLSIKQARELAKMNDNNESFAVIAEFIELNY